MEIWRQLHWYTVVDIREWPLSNLLIFLCFAQTIKLKIIIVGVVCAFTFVLWHGLCYKRILVPIHLEALFNFLIDVCKFVLLLDLLWTGSISFHSACRFLENGQFDVHGVMARLWMGLIYNIKLKLFMLSLRYCIPDEKANRFESPVQKYIYLLFAETLVNAKIRKY